MIEPVKTSEATLFCGDCMDALRFVGDASVDACVTDPPYGLGFMGKHWDHGVPSSEVWAEVLRVLKPGGYLLAFGGTRTYHRMTCAIEDAGFEIRDQIGWAFGSGFPKSHNGEWGGTALKPAWEPICMARKPLIGTVDENWKAHGTGALNIDGCRVGAEGGTAKGSKPQGAGNGIYGAGLHGACEITQLDAGRWPANLIHDGSDEVLAAFPQAKGQQGAVGPQYGDKASVNAYGDFGPRQQFDPRGDAGSAARFFYCSKASREDRNDGCEAMPKRPLNWSSGEKNPGSFQASGTDRSAHNNHPTVKPTELMRYLCRLVTPPGGFVLDPFMGSGSTGRGASLEGFRFIGIEREPAYFEIAVARIQAASRQLRMPLEVDRDAQMSLLGAAL